MATAVAERHIALAKSLPQRLQRFFVFNPPKQLMSALPSRISGIESTETGEVPLKARAKPNPFSPHKNTKTGRWNPPIYSLRRQADLAKMAHSYGVEELLPYTKKKPSERQRRRDELGLRIKGTGVGQRVKGHLWERTLKQRLEKRRQAMLAMPQMIQDWKQRGHGRGWKKWPPK